MSSLTLFYIFIFLISLVALIIGCVVLTSKKGEYYDESSICANFKDYCDKCKSDDEGITLTGCSPFNQIKSIPNETALMNLEIKPCATPPYISGDYQYDIPDINKDGGKTGEIGPYTFDGYSIERPIPGMKKRFKFNKLPAKGFYANSEIQGLGSFDLSAEDGVLTAEVGVDADLDIEMACDLESIPCSEIPGVAAAARKARDTVGPAAAAPARVAACSLGRLALKNACESGKDTLKNITGQHKLSEVQEMVKDYITLPKAIPLGKTKLFSADLSSLCEKSS